MRVIFTGAALLLTFFVSRLFLLEAIPPFIDEAFVLDLGRRMIQTSPLYGAGEGRTLSAWYWLVLQAPYNAPFWVARYGNLLVITLGVGAVLGVAQLVAGYRAMLAAGLLATFSPYHTFFGSFATTEALMTGFILLAVYFTYRLSRRVHRADAILAGASLTIACGMKVAALPFGIVPALGVLALGTSRFRERVGWGVWAYGTFAVLYGGFLGVLFWRGYQPLYMVFRASGGGPNLWNRTVEISGAYVTYMGWALGAVVLGSALYALFQRRFFLAGVLLVPGATLWLSSGYFTRYLYPYLSVLLLLAAIGISRRRWAVWGVGALALAGWIPFAYHLTANPQALTIPPRDFAEHYMGDAAGSGLAEVAAFLVEQEAEQVIGLLANCTALELSTLGTLNVACPRVSATGEDIEPLAALVAANRRPGVFVVQENIPYVPQTIPGTPIYEVERPGGRTRLTIYDLSP